MKVKRINYPTDLSIIKDKEDDNIDVFVELEDGSSITLVISTPNNLLSQMEGEQLNYMFAPMPDIIVKSLTPVNIQEAIEMYAEKDAFWMKVLFAISIDRNVINMDRINEFFQEIKHLNNDLIK
ncbi:hypothetical protein D3C75_543290 [compost metagenome]|uniref:hypothetical protein n=1 Tax=Paenibacillus sp. CGMCC 1.18879 TaxID=2834466 RepID=UPI000FB01562|nr:hypothetical protein [Paenibacillus sp. CGMCC 1.18879]MBY9079567.1 hypothetical protein [Paenibacillus sp. CGMCC 1.18879]